MSDSDTTKLKVRYDETSATYANQIVVTANREDLILDFSSGAVPDPQSGEPVLPIHSRIALSWAGASRLRALIDQAIGRQEDAVKKTAAAAKAASKKESGKK